MAEQVTVSIDPNTLKLREVSLIEEITGQPLSSLFDGAPMSAKAVIALVTVLKRRENPEFTVAEAEEFAIGDINFSEASGDPKADTETS